jgi:tetratricopeptide (TPR) repeat protein
MVPFDRALFEYLIADTLIVHETLLEHVTNHRAQYEAAKRLVELAPGSEFGLKLARAAWDNNRLHEALRTLEGVDPNTGWIRSMDYWGDVAQLRFLLGDYRGALEATRHEAEQRGWNLPQIQRRASWSAMLGDADDVRRAIAEISAKATPADAYFYLPFVALDGANGLRFAGRKEEATRLLEWGVTYMDTSSAAPEVAKDRIKSLYAANQRAFLRYELGRLREAQLIYEQLISTLTDLKNRDQAVALQVPSDAMISVYGDLGSIAARLGDSTAAERYRRLILAEIPPGGGSEKYNVGRIAALQGHRDEAVRWLRAACEVSIGCLGPLRSDPDLDALRNYPPFRALLVLPAN